MSQALAPAQQSFWVESGFSPEAVQFIRRQRAPDQSRSISQHLFIGGEASAIEAPRHIGIGIRKSEQRIAAIAAFDIKHGNSAGHSSTSRRREVRTLTGGEDSGRGAAPCGRGRRGPHPYIPR